MRPLLIPAIFAFLFLVGRNARAQEGGRFILPGGEFTLSHSIDRSATGLSILPQAEYFLTDRWSLGAIKVMDVSFQSELLVWGLLPSTRLFFSAPDRKVQFFGAVAVGPLGAFLDGNTAWGGAIVAAAGANFFFTPEAAGELALRYSSGFGFGDVDATAQLGLDFGFQGFLNQPGEAGYGTPPALGRGVWIVGSSSARIGILESGSPAYSLQVRPDGLWFAGQRIALGGALPIEWGENALQVGVLPAIRYYGAKATCRWPWFLALSGGYLHGRTLGATESTVRTREWQLRPELGLNFFLHPSLALEGRTGYTFRSFNLDQSDALGGRDFAAEINDLFLTIALQVFLRPRS